MTTQPTYIYSDAECVLHWMKYYSEPTKLPDMDLGVFFGGLNDYKNWKLEKAKSTAVKFADQDYAGGVIALKYGTIKPNTIYTVEGYEVDRVKPYLWNEGSYENECRGCANNFIGAKLQRVCKNCCETIELATLKRIEPGVSVEQENDGWDKVYDHYKRDLEKYGSLDGGYSEWLKIKYHAPKPINPPKQ